ncbi:hypothetical protein [Azospirillum endophyticum]
MRGKSLHAPLGRTVPHPAWMERTHPQGSADTAHDSPPSARAVLGEAALTVAAFLLIALALQALVIWIGA